MKRIPVGCQFALVDNEDYIRISQHNWYPTGGGEYAGTMVDRVCVLMHRMVLNYFGTKDIHHNNKNTLDNRKKNLQILSRRNHVAFHPRVSATKLTGVYTDNRNLQKKWRARVRFNGKLVDLGYYKTSDSAVLARKIYLQQLQKLEIK